MKKLISKILLGSFAVNLLVPCVFGESNEFYNDYLYAEESAFEENFDGETNEYFNADNVIFASEGGAPGILSSGDNVLARFGSSYLDTSAPVTMDFGSDSDSPVKSAKVVVCKSGASLMGCGIRNNVPFVTSEENTYIAVTYYVRAETDNAINPHINGMMQYCTANGSSGGNVIKAVAGLKTEQELENGVWYKCFQIFKVENTGYSASGKDFTALRFVLNAGQAGQTTYLGGFSAYTFGTEFDCFDAPDTQSAIAAYIEQPKLSEISLGGSALEGFSPDVYGYVVRADDTNADVTTKQSVFSTVEIEEAENNPRTVKLTVNTYNADKLNKYGEYANTNIYTVRIMQSDALSAENFGIYNKDDVLTDKIEKGKNTIKLKLKNTGAALDTELIFTVLNSDTKACAAVKHIDVHLGENETSAEISEVIEIADNSDYEVKIFAVDKQTYKPCTGNLAGDDYISPGGDFDKIRAVMNYEKSVIEASGKLKSGIGNRFFAAVFGGNNSDSLDSLCFADVITASPDGTFLCEFVPCNTDKYTSFAFCVFDEELNIYQGADFEYFDASIIQKAAEWFETASESDVSDALNEKILINGNVGASVIFGESLNLYKALANKAYVDKMLSKTKFESSAALAAAFENAVADAAICDEFNLCGKDEFCVLVEKYAEKLSIDMNDKYAYKSIADENKGEIFDIAAKKRNFASPSEISDSVNGAVILFLFNNSSWGDIAELSAYYADVLKIDLNSEKFTSLSETGRANVFKAMQAEEFAENKEISDKFTSETDVQYGLENSQTRQNGKSSGGGSSKGGTISVVPTISSDEPKDDNTVKFSDISENNWAKDYIYNLCKKGIINGFDDGTFKPENELTRAEFVKMAVLAAEIFSENCNVDYYDCQKNDWYYPFVASAVENKIINGISENYFAPGEKITRQDMAVIVFRILKMKNIDFSDNGECDLNDFNEISDYAKDSVSKICRLGIINGDENKKFAPLNFATRAEAAKVIYEMLSLQ